jgi:hypothetical protein
MSLYDFYIYIEEILVKNEAFFYVKRKSNSSFDNVLVTKNNLKSIVTDYQTQYSNFFISSEYLDINQQKFSFYDNNLINYLMEGVGGRESQKQVEIIKLRILSKTPEKQIKSTFSLIKNKLNKDFLIGKGLYTPTTFYKDYFYLKSCIGHKEISFDFFNNKLPILTYKISN